jgi:hypothetical protein
MAVATNDAELHRTEHDRDRDGPITDAVVEALAAVEGVEPENLDLRLYDSIDGDAVERLYEITADRGERLRLAFTVGEYEVVVDNRGYVAVREPDGEGREPRR